MSFTQNEEIVCTINKYLTTKQTNETLNVAIYQEYLAEIVSILKYDRDQAYFLWSTLFSKWVFIN